MTARVKAIPRESAVLIGETLFTKLSPLQQRIVKELSYGPLTLTELSERTTSSVYTVAKQLSIMQRRTKYNPLEGKGITHALVRKTKEAGLRTTYSLISGI